jgi:ubiquinone/menaquinone biosynthesis C-methylase UbiE
MRTALLLAITAIAVAAPSLHSQAVAPQSSSRPVERRDDWQRVPDIFKALGAATGARIADLGAGEGWLTTRLAKQVGPTGRVFASDISERSLTSLSQTLATAGLQNVELMLATDTDPNLPFASLDGVVIVNAYHEMTERVPILDGIKKSLKPAGVLVIVDNHPAESAKTRREQTAQHTLALELARDDLEAQGYEIISSDPAFIQRGAEGHNNQWIIVARPKARR